MTRINAGIPVEDLTDRHLIAEHREIKRIPNAVASGRFSLEGQPKEFTLGKGHVKFFYDKLWYLQNRYEQIYQECKRRGFNVSYFGTSWDNVPIKFMKNYVPNQRDINIIKERIKEKSKNDKT